MKKRADITAEDLLAGYAPKIRTLVNTVRSIVTATIPGAEERVYPGWRGIGFRHKNAGYFCGVFPFDNSVKIFFEYGKYLPDPDRILSGRGKQTGFILLKTVRDIKTDSFKNLLKESLEFGSRIKSN